MLATVTDDSSSSVTSPRLTDPENQQKITISPKNLAFPNDCLALPAIANHHADPLPRATSD
ncbi:hypothetical protein TIFTF001_020356 [Ficus carica]|uniref:Uncharacterized protein n=1 Tax=Ficus carica TaxID=3494 RepID=A0AA88AFW5_FICCA|nr:hypothetical protein TIFTF001_020356 [Ficus carica]